MTDDSTSPPRRAGFRIPGYLASTRLGATFAFLLLLFCADATAQRDRAVVAYAYSSEPSAPTFEAPEVYAYTPGRGSVTVTRLAQGSYRVAFERLGLYVDEQMGGFGHVQASAYGTQSVHCKPYTWNLLAMDLTVDVRCFNHDLILTDSRFTVLAIFPGGNPGHLAWTLAVNRTSDRYVPDERFSYNSEGGQVRVTRSSVGSYEVSFGGLGFLGETGAGSLGHVQVSAQDSQGEICKVSSWIPDGLDLLVNVLCYDNAGPVDTAYDVLTLWPGSDVGSLAYVYAENATSPSYEPASSHAYNPAGGPISVVRTGVGAYDVTFDGFGEAFSTDPGGWGHVQVTPVGLPFESDYCSIRRWTSGLSPTVSIQCFEQFGSFVAPADTRFTLMLLVQQVPPIQEAEITFESFDDGMILWEAPTRFGKILFPDGVEIIECNAFDDSCVRARSGSKVATGKSITAITREPFTFEFEVPQAEVEFVLNGFEQNGVLYDYRVIVRDSLGAEIGPAGVIHTFNASPAWSFKFSLDVGENMISRVEIYGDSPFLFGDEGLILVDDLFFRRRLSPIGVEDEPESAANSLKQNFPNPFEDETTISYDLSRASTVNLKVFDVIGRAVLIRSEGVQLAGRHDLRLSLSDLSPGIYLYQLQADGFVETRRMILAR